MIDQIENNSSQQVKKGSLFSRRDFLKYLLTGVAVIGAEVTLRPIGLSTEVMARAGWLGEGHPAQRAASLERIVQMIELDPSNEEKKKVLGSWLKFNAAEIYGHFARDPFSPGQGEPIASNFVRHFCSDTVIHMILCLNTEGHGWNFITGGVQKKLYQKIHHQN